MNLLLRPLPSPPERARPARRPGKRVLRGSPGASAELPAAAMAALSVEEGARAEREAPLRGRRALPAVRAGRAQAGPRAPRPPLARSVPAPRSRRRRRPRRSRPFWAPRSAFAINTQEMHNLTCEVEPFPLWSPGRRLAEASGARGGARRPPTGRAQGEAGFAETGFIYSPSARPGGRRRGAGGRGAAARTASRPTVSPWVPPKLEPPSHLRLRPRHLCGGEGGLVRNQFPAPPPAGGARFCAKKA